MKLPFADVVSKTENANLIKEEHVEIITGIIGAIVGFFVDKLFRRGSNYFTTSKPLYRVFENLILNSEDERVIVVLSTVSADDYRDRNGKVIDYSYDLSEKKVTMVKDAEGLTYVTLLLEKAKKRPSLVEYQISDERRDEDWDKNLILLGSPLANDYTRDALCVKRHLIFNEEVTKIIDRDEDKEYGRDPKVDYAIVAKISEEKGAGKKVRIILAGLGPRGTAGACHYIYNHFRQLAKWLKQQHVNDFQILLEVERNRGFTSYKEIKKIASH